MTTGNLTFAVIGRGSLVRSCSESLVARGLNLAVVVSPDAGMADWCATLSIDHGRELEVLEAALPARTRRVLLSISNDRLIPAAILDAFDLAVNFHDGPLPQYSGSHVTSWALMAGERSHAITWHCMTSRADAGDILLQVPVTISADETALSLNGKCHQAALASFPALLDSIVGDSLSPRPQNPKLRRFFARDRRPDRCAIIDCSKEAADIDALVRALACGAFVNRLGVPKLWIGDSFVTVGRSHVRAARSRKPPGTVLGLNDTGLELATASHDLLLNDFATLDGKPLDIGELRAVRNLEEGTVLHTRDPRVSLSIEEAEACQLRQEEVWMRHFTDLSPLALPLLPHPASDACQVTIEGEPDQLETMFALVVAWLGSLAATDRFDVGLRAGVRSELIADFRPFRVTAISTMPFEAFRTSIAQALAVWRARGAYLRDAPTRYPAVRLPAGWAGFEAWPVLVELGTGTIDHSVGSLCVSIDAATGAVRLATKPGGLAASALHAMGAQLLKMLDAVRTDPATPVGSWG